MNKTYWLKNVTLETGFETSDDIVTTTTALFNILIQDGIITKIVNNTCSLEPGVKIYDAKGLLMVPPYTEKHSHIDKTYVGENWRAPEGAKNILDIVTSEAALYPTFKTSIEYRAKKLIDMFIENGSTTIRTHVDVVKGTKLNHLEQVLSALNSYGDKIQYEIIAFPQHGLLLSDSVKQCEYALKNGATLLGGVDPEIIDKDRDRSLEKTMEIAVKYNVGIDYHLHESGKCGLKSFKKLLSLIKEAKWQNRVSISHGFFLSDLNADEALEVATDLRENGITLITHVPLKNIPDFMYFSNKGVNVALGSDCINDSWWPYGNGNILERLGWLGLIFGIKKEKDLANSLKFITSNVTPLNKNGNRVWPMPLIKANFLLVDGVCTAHVVGRRLPNKCVVNNGIFAYGEL